MRTTIICTIGPSSASEEMIVKMIKAGMSVARLNFSHGTHEEHAALILAIRAAAKKVGTAVTILQDLQGPKIRVGALPPQGVPLVVGSEVIFTTGEADIKALRLPVTYDRLHEDLEAGETILFADGLLSAVVTKIKGQDIFCKVIDGGQLYAHKGINIPNATLSTPTITEKDKEDARFGLAQGVDWMAISFVRRAQDLHDLRDLLQASVAASSGTLPKRLVTKIEQHEAITDIDAIIEASDAVMVARGDLGVEMPLEDVPGLQKRIIRKCRAASKPVIVATQMLQSMVNNPRPTRAEVSDVANAVYDGADTVMLSDETAMGKYPLDAVSIMARIVRKAERDLDEGLLRG